MTDSQARDLIRAAERIAAALETMARNSASAPVGAWPADHETISGRVTTSTTFAPDDPVFGR